MKNSFCIVAVLATKSNVASKFDIVAGVVGVYDQLKLITCGENVYYWLYSDSGLRSNFMQNATNVCMHVCTCMYLMPSSY